MPIATGTRFGSYEVVSLLGAGGMGEVYRARDARLGREVALKFLPDLFASDAERLARFRREANVLASLNHPQIATIFGLEETPGAQPGAGSLFLVMELVEGEDLSQRIGHGPIPLEEVLALAAQIADALEAAHDAGVIHRDLKPANIKVRPDGNIKVLDFGLAKAVENSGASGQNISLSPTMTSPAQMTSVGVILGTAAYMSPEQAKGRVVDKRADVWAFGAVLYEMLTGRRAFEGDDVSDTFAAILRALPDWSALPAATPPALHRLLRRSLEKDPRARISDMAMVRLELREAVRELAQPAAPATPAAQPRKSPVRRVFPYAAAIVMAAATGILVWTLRRPTEPAREIVRFSFDLPPNMQLSTPSRKPVAVSRDGRMLAFVANQRIFVRQVDQLEAQPLVGTEQGGNGGFGRTPAFSPDGEWLVYWQSGELKKISTHGGAAVTLCPHPNIPAGISWEAGDEIFVGEGLDGIARVRASGGFLEGVPAANGARSSFPQLLPGGEWLLFLLHEASASVQNGQVVARSLKTGEQRVLVKGANDVRFVPPGYILFGNNANLMAQAIDVRTVTMTGAAVPVLEGLGSLGAFPGLQGVVSDSGTMFYTRGTQQSQVTATKLVQVSRSGKPAPLIDVPGLTWFPRFSPDGSRVAYGMSASADLGTDSDLWVVDVRRGARTRVTFAANNRFYPIWTKDGMRLTFADASTATNRLLTAAADGSGQVEVLLDTGPRRFPTSWSPDGRVLALYGSKTAVGSASGNRDLMMLTRESGKVSVTSFIETPFEERGAIFSPNGKWIAYVTDKSGINEVVARPFPGPGSELTISVGGGQEPVWSPDGRELFYRKDNKLLVVRVTETPTSIVTSAPQPLFDDPYRRDTGGASGGVANYDISPDGQRFVMVEEPPTAVAASAEPVRLIVVVNWIEEVKKRLPH